MLIQQKCSIGNTTIEYCNSEYIITSGNVVVTIPQLHAEEWFGFMKALCYVTYDPNEPEEIATVDEPLPKDRIDYQIIDKKLAINFIIDKKREYFEQLHAKEKIKVIDGTHWVHVSNQDKILSMLQEY